MGVNARRNRSGGGKSDGIGIKKGIAASALIRPTTKSGFPTIVGQEKYGVAASRRRVSSRFTMGKSKVELTAVCYKKPRLVGMPAACESEPPKEVL